MTSFWREIGGTSESIVMSDALVCQSADRSSSENDSSFSSTDPMLLLRRLRRTKPLLENTAVSDTHTLMIYTKIHCELQILSCIWFCTYVNK